MFCRLPFLLDYRQDMVVLEVLHTDWWEEDEVCLRLDKTCILRSLNQHNRHKSHHMYQSLQYHNLLDFVVIPIPFLIAFVERMVFGRYHSSSSLCALY